MGFNVQGIATSFKTTNVAELMKRIGMNNTPVASGTANFETATSSSIEDDELYLTAASGGTILIVGDDIPIHDYSLDRLSVNGKALKFMVGETSMVFAFDYYENGKLVRSVVNTEGQNIQEEGDKLEEESEEDFTEIIFKIMERVTGDSIYTMEPDVPSARYRFHASGKAQKPAIQVAQPAAYDNKVSVQEKGKKWWQFWK